MFSAFQTFGRLGAGARAVAAAWTPAALWPTGTEPGMWIDPSDLTTSWQDSTGTTPVSTPGTVADSSNPVGLALDIRAGAPDTLGPEAIINGDFATSSDWTLTANAVISGGKLNVSAATGVYENVATQSTGGRVAIGKYYEVTFDVVCSAGQISFFIGDLVFADKVGQVNINASGAYHFVHWCRNADNFFFRSEDGFTGSVNNISVKEIPGNHLLQATSTARPLLSAYDGQTLGPGNTYDATGYPIYQKYDGTDDGMATASFAAGTLSNAMDCMIAVKRDSGANCVVGLYQGLGVVFGEISGVAVISNEAAGTPTVWVDGVQVPGGTSVYQTAMNDAVTVGDWHIVEWRGLDLSAWTAAKFGAFGFGYNTNGAQGGILLFPSSTSAADRDAARTWLGAKVGLTL